jgi:hypothetical protein
LAWNVYGFIQPYIHWVRSISRQGNKAATAWSSPLNSIEVAKLRMHLSNVQSTDTPPRRRT